MALFSNYSGSDLFSDKSSREVMDSFWKSLSGRMALMSGDKCLQFLQQARAELLAEEAVDVAMGTEIAELLGNLSSVRFSDELAIINVRLLTLVADHFKARSSVNALFQFSTACREQLLATALTLAVESLKLEGFSAPSARYALISFGDLGRREIRMNGPGTLIMLFEDPLPRGEEDLNRVALRLEAILIECRLPISVKANSGSRFWRGSVSRWLEELEAAVTGAGESGRTSFAQTFEMLADCRCLCGDEALAALALDKSGLLLQNMLTGENFRHYAKSVANMPLALGIFGRLRTSRTGKHRGEFSLEDLVITPLIAAVRVLAVHEGISETATSERIWSLLKSGILSVNLAERLLAAFRKYNRHQIELEIIPDGNEKRFFNPDTLEDDARALFKEGLEDIGTLQRRVYQQIIEVD